MKINVSHPSFISFLETITNSILSAIKIDDYFKLTKEKQLSVSFTVLNLLKNSAKVKANLNDTELKSFITFLCKKNEEKENYEFAAVLNDVIKNFDTINELSNSTKKTPKSSKKVDANSSQLPQGPQQ
jgi:hypothetical protein